MLRDIKNFAMMPAAPPRRYEFSCPRWELRSYLTTVVRRGGLFKGLSQDGDGTIFIKNLRVSPSYDDLSIDTVSTRLISLDSTFKTGK
jgi:hypothetical protein